MTTKTVFVGNRRFVLDEIFSSGLDVTGIFIVKGSHLHRDLESGRLSNVNRFKIVENKNQLLNYLNRTEYDLLVSNGCPYILPVSKLRKAIYVNIHPSYLPDLRGIDPVIGSVLFAKDSGATCHLMDNGIDTGPVISQVRIQYTKDLDVTTLYQLSFLAERRVFREALRNDFVQQYKQKPGLNDLSYSRRPEDRQISFLESNELIIRKVKAFNNKSVGCTFEVNGETFKVLDARRMNNPFLLEIVYEFPPGVVALSYEDGVVFHKDGEVLRFSQLDNGNNTNLVVGDQLFAP